MINKVILVGNTGADPEIRSLPSGSKVASLRMATSRRYRTKAGEDREETQWHRIECFGKDAEFVEQYVRKGARLYVEGRIEYRQYEDRDGNTRYMTEIKAGWPDGDIRLLDSRREGTPGPAAKAAGNDAIDVSADLPTIDISDLPDVG